jgi:virulence-associated protein VapD
MKHRFLTVYDYGQGGVWQYVNAETAEQITAKYPALQIVKSEPQWLKDSKQSLREYDIEDAPDQVMAGFTKKS